MAMKKLFGLLVFLGCLCMTPTHAQVQFGVKGGLTSSKISLDLENFRSGNRMGWFLGPTLKIKTPVFIGADISALYDQRKIEINDQTFTQKTIEIPVNARLNFDLAEGTGFFFAIGPQFGFNVGKDEFKWTEKNSYESTFQLKKSNFSLNFGAGVMVADHLEVSVVYNVALGNTGELENTLEAMKQEKTDTKAKTLQISAALLF